MKIQLAGALRFLDLIEMPWRMVTDADGHLRTYPWPDEAVRRYPGSWTGLELLVTPERSATDLLHEACHFLEAPRSRRWLAEFGLGEAGYIDLDRDYPLAKAVKIDEDVDDDDGDAEVRTCLLELYLLHLTGGAWKKRAQFIDFNDGLASWDTFWSHRFQKPFVRQLERTRRRAFHLIHQFADQERSIRA